MKIKVFKMRLAPTEAQKSRLNQYIGAARKMQNLLLDDAQQRYRQWLADGQPKDQRPQLTHIGFNYRVTEIKHRSDLEWMNDYPVVTYQRAAYDLANAFSRFFSKKAKFPKFKSRFDKNSVQFTPQYFHIVNGKLLLSRFGTLISVRWDKRKMPNSIKMVTVVRRPSGHYDALFACEVEEQQVDLSVTGSIGIDLGIKDLAVTSDGEILKNPKYYIQGQKKLKQLSQRVSRRKPPKGVKASKRYLLAKQQLAKHHEHMSNQRKDLLHKFTTNIVRQYRVIVIEDLAPSNMMKNHRLAKHVGDAAFRMMRTMFEYKVKWSNTSTLIVADRWYPSTQLCSCCGKRPEQKLLLKVREWTCAFCNTRHHRDFNASMNLERISYSYTDRINNLRGGVIQANPFMR